MNEFIKAENNIDKSVRFESLEEEIFYYQLKYVERILDGKIKINSDIDLEKEDEYKLFKDLIENNTDYLSIMCDGFNDRVLKTNYSSEEDYEKELDSFIENVFVQVFNIYNKNKKEWKIKIQEIIKENLEKLGPVFKKNNENEYIKNIFSSDSLSVLASRIVDEYPDVKAILGTSWIVGSPIGKRIGFNVIDVKKDLKRNDGFWGQFINEKGDLNKDRMNRFLENGVPDFYVSTGFIKVEDFLKKYLPKDKRGIIKLKERSSRAINFINDTEWINDKNIKKFSFQEIFDQLNKNELMANFLKTENGIKILEILKQIKDLGIENFDKLDFPNKEIYMEIFKRFIKSTKEDYIEKEIYIP